MSRSHPRPSTPRPTVPPELADEPSAVQRLVTSVPLVWALIGIAVALLGAGAAAYAWQLGKADVAELHQVRDGATAALTAAQAGTSAQLGALATSVQDLRVRQAKAETATDKLAADVSRLQSTADVLYIQLVEIARVTGARRVPAPEPEPVTRPP